ncbi:hypothetical protein IKG28_00680 [Candidatus Saccharibacteria bacterium]|nr:hypothetical protein [Candidatus Saccharibacteria bacterium]MBR3332138.1 hypothetical protein [Candidatus Saccharibacteria bacterium]
MTVGGRNLLILGVMSIVIAAGTAGVSLAVYHNTGDIYLDRSRPGYLPDEDEIEDEEDDKEEEDYEFSASGKITKEIMKEYLEKLKFEIEDIDAYEDTFEAESLSDEKLGI